jgi:hypothetical protein
LNYKTDAVQKKNDVSVAFLQLQATERPTHQVVFSSYPTERITEWIFIVADKQLGR